MWAVAVAAHHLQRGAEQLQIFAHHPHLRLHRLLRRRAVRPLLPPVDRLSVAGPSSTIPVAAAAPPAVGGPRGVSAPSCIRIPTGNVYPSRASIAFPSSKPPPYHDDQLATSWQTVARTNWSAVSSFLASSTSRRTQRSPASAWRNDESTTGTHL